MSPRELIILLLGLAIVGVVLRGLYVGIRARRNQIRLAIDKNIPQDVDLEELELSELPAGGARVVSRGGAAEAQHHDATSPQPAVDRARARAAAMDLDEDDDQIPVLMDAVTLGDTQADDEANHDVSDESRGEDYSAEQTREEADEIVSWDEDPRDADRDPALADEGEDVLLDYDLNDPSSTEDPMASVRPDYEDDEGRTAQDYEEDSTEDEPDAFPGMEAEAGADYEEDEDLNESAAVLAAHEDVPDEESQNPADFEDSLGGFSMPAGERIGFERRTPTLKAVDQHGLFDEADVNAETRTAAPAEAARPPPKRKSFFSAFTRRHAEKPPAPDRQEEEPRQQAPTAKVEPASTGRAQESNAGQSPAASNSLQQPSEVLVINVMAREGRAFAGEELLEVLITSGLKFGDMQIFHHRLGGDPKGPVVFSVANILNPGTFDLNAMEEFATVGISFFLALPAPMNNLEAFEQMLATARHIQKQMDGELKDDNRNVMTAQTIEHYRERVRNFELRQLKAAGSRG